MAFYDLKCTKSKCKYKTEVNISMKKFHTLAEMKCPKCDSDLAQRWDTKSIGTKWNCDGNTRGYNNK